jgi:nucleotide-binding universal stress UspA family protein
MRHDATFDIRTQPTTLRGFPASAIRRAADDGLHAPVDAVGNTEVTQMKDDKRIVIATDGSPGSRAAVDEGLSLAESMDADVTFVSVRPSPSPVLGDPYYQRALARELDRSRAALASAVEFAEKRGVDCEAESLEGDPAEQIARLARDREADLVVVGSRGLGPFKGALLGSVSSGVVRRAGRPVFVVRRRAGVPARTAA